MMIFSEDMEIGRSIPVMIALYSASLLEASKSKLMAYSIISPIEALSCCSNPALNYREAPTTFRVHKSELSDFVSY